MSFEKSEKSTGTRHKARECALQMLFSADVVGNSPQVTAGNYWAELGETALDSNTREFADRLAIGTLTRLNEIDEVIRVRAEHWRIERMAIVDRNIIRLAVFEFLDHETPSAVAINEALELARRFSSFESTQFINGLLDAVRVDVDGTPTEEDPVQSSTASSS